jgi:hypothetical protein
MKPVPRRIDELFVDPVVVLEQRPDGSRRFRSRTELPAHYGRCTGEWLERWAGAAPERVFLAERGQGGDWVQLSYGAARDRVLRIATWMLGQRLSAQRPVVILSDNGIEHALLMLAAMHIGVPSCAISPGNSLLSKDHAKLKANIELLRPGVHVCRPAGALHGGRRGRALLARRRRGGRVAQPAAGWRRAAGRAALCPARGPSRPNRGGARLCRPSDPIPLPNSCSPPDRSARPRPSSTPSACFAPAKRPRS